jgi:probable HAF family extracellular repeat protein
MLNDKQTQNRFGSSLPTRIGGLMLAVGLAGYALLSVAQVQNRYTVTDLGPLGGSSNAFAINARGEVVGFTTVPNSDFYQAYIYSGGQMHEITPSGAEFSEANSINNGGEGRSSRLLLRSD